MADDEEVQDQEEKGAEDAGKEDADDLDAVINIDDLDEDLEKEEDADAKKAKEGSAAAKKAPTAEDIAKERDELVRKNKDLNRALHEARTAKKAETKEEVVLTDEQIKGLLEEYKDDPATLMNVMKYMAQQAAKGEAKKTISDADVVRKKKEAEDYIYKTYPDLTVEDSQLRAQVNRVKDELGIQEHPFGELFGTAVSFFTAAPMILKEAYDKGRADAEAGVAEKTRKELIKGTGLSPKGKSAGATGGLAENVKDVSQRLGLTSPKQIALLKKLTAAGKGARTVQVEE